VLPAAHRLTDADSFRVAVRSGRRGGSTTLVVHLHTGAGDDTPAQVGFVVSKAVGNAVVRNRVKRRLRHLTREHLAQLGALPGPVVLVVRALPAAAHASYEELGRDLGRCLARVTA
jgi:ribonuclease P protein component